MTRFALCADGDMNEDEARRFEVGGHIICVVRCEDDYYAIGDTCSHADFSLSEGEVLCEERQIECWKHGSAFDLATGEALTLPATRPVPHYDVTVQDGTIFVEVDA
jgi:3-phenylpropionate/trans-cinnamate dioxygenase ferredoxin component